MAQVVLKDINKFYDTVHVVKDVNLQIRDKEFVVFVGPVGLRQDHDAAHDRRARGDQLGRHLHRRHGGQRPGADGPRHRHGVPELRALPAHERLRQHGVRPQDAQIRARPRSRSASSEAADILGIGELPQAQAAPALRRPAPARRAGPRHRARSQGVPVRRAAVQPRRQAARADARRAQEAAPAARHHGRLRHPRPGRGHDAGRPRRGHEGRRGPAGRRAARALQSRRPTSSWPASSARRP